MSKKTRSAEEPKPADCTAIEQLQTELESIEEEFDAKVLEVQAQYNKKKLPFFTKRTELIAALPNFWFQALSNHRVLETLLHDNDAEIFKSLTALVVEEKDDIKSGFKITASFSANSFFNNAELWKEFTFTEDGHAEVTQSEVQWKEGKNPTLTANKGKKRPYQPQSFFSFFEEADVDDVEVGNIIKDSLWPNPMKYYLGDVSDESFPDDDDEEDSEGADEEGEGEEEGEEEGEGEGGEAAQENAAEA
eukprot:NODE_1010_length_1167_cov_375.711091_g478_i7.p1 GENE.NODE_1010_length_1167_cov_375.711091_g478_i7~~NODE_1010_length_1167_cov_375.711091_g478_i7.p1  ORF type:complete len:267 (-),score=99.48 NODE_1010_length_1167_cov_375.711091_g478_i7:366-1109(-)